MHKYFLLAALIAALLCLGVYTGCSGDDDDDSGRSSGDDDDDDDDDIPPCDSDRTCLHALNACIQKSDTVEELHSGCWEDLEKCATNDGCLDAYADCMEECFSDLECKRACAAVFVPCVQGQCNVDDMCMATCVEILNLCTDPCGTFDGECIKACYNDFDSCFDPCWPDAE